MIDIECPACDGSGMEEVDDWCWSLDCHTSRRYRCDRCEGEGMVSCCECGDLGCDGGEECDARQEECDD